MIWPQVKDECEIFSPQRFSSGIRVGAFDAFRAQLDNALSNLLSICPALNKLQDQRPPEVSSHIDNPVS